MSNVPSQCLLVFRINLTSFFQFFDEFVDGSLILFGVEVDDEGVDHFEQFVVVQQFKVLLLLECLSGFSSRAEVRSKSGVNWHKAVVGPFGGGKLHHEDWEGKEGKMCNSSS